MIIDVHAHALHESFIAEMAGVPSFPMPFEKMKGGGYRIAGYGPMDPLVYDIAGRVKSLESRGVDLQLIGPPPKVISNEAAAMTISWTATAAMRGLSVGGVVFASGGMIGTGPRNQ